MKISEIIKHLEHSLNTYGDNNVKMCFVDGANNRNEFETIHFIDDVKSEKIELCMELCRIL